MATNYGPTNAVSGPQSPAPKPALPRSFRHKATSRVSGPDVNELAVGTSPDSPAIHSQQQQNQNRPQQNVLNQQMQQLCQQKHSQKTIVPPVEMTGGGDESPDHWDYSERDDAATTHNDGIAKTCAHCGTSKTPLWRNGPPGPKSLCNACGIRFNKIRSGKRKASPQEAVMLREYETVNPAFSKPLPQSPVQKARTKLPRAPAGPLGDNFVSFTGAITAGVASSNSDCDTVASDVYLEKYRPSKKQRKSSPPTTPLGAQGDRTGKADSTGVSCLSIQGARRFSCTEATAVGEGRCYIPSLVDLNEASPGTGGSEESEVCGSFRRKQVEEEACLLLGKEQQAKREDEDDVVLGAELLLSLFDSSPM
ncbi:unnamed protein product [Closterium sp. NIES-64]|nr:unnamed protein product [Closterium sp. NIES-64]